MRSLLCLPFNFTISPKAKAAAHLTTVPVCSELVSNPTIAWSSLDGNRCAVLPITLAASHLMRGAFSLRHVTTKSNAFLSMISGDALLANSRASMQVAFSGPLAFSANVIISETLISFFTIS